MASEFGVQFCGFHHQQHASSSGFLFHKPRCDAVLYCYLTSRRMVSHMTSMVHHQRPAVLPVCNVTIESSHLCCARPASQTRKSPTLRDPSTIFGQSIESGELGTAESRRSKSDYFVLRLFLLLTGDRSTHAPLKQDTN